ncbi:NACHT domain-containing protein, partial [Nostoc sp. ChiVER01]|uniref:NACHT domain-containing protein n=1 Tax=Nostoc sp. ChiVER01 TaxID=3075382 RepID=UPI002AD570EC
MAVMQSLISIVCPAIAKFIFSTWLQNLSSEKAVKENIVDKIKNFITNPSDQEKTQRITEKIAQQIVEQVEPIFDLEAANLSENSRTAIKTEIAETLQRAEVTNELLMSFNLDAKRLTPNLRSAYPKACKHFDRNETALYERILEEVSKGIIELAPQLQNFTLAATTETLHRLEEIITHHQTLKEQSQREKTDFETKYRDAIIRKLDKLEVFGMGPMDDIATQQSLSTAYITLSATQHGREEENQEAEIFSRSLTEEIAVHSQKDDKTTRLQTSLVNETLVACRKIVIRGEAGAGKSTLLQWLAVRAAKQDFPSVLESWNWLTPFFIRLRSFVDTDFPTPEEFPKLHAPNITDTMPKGWVHQCLKDGYALVLIDGVDELPRHKRQDFLDALADLMATYPYARYIVTSRPTGLKDSQGETWHEWERWTEKEGFLNLSLQPMSPSDIEQFVTQWHNALLDACRPEDQQIDLSSTANDLKRLLHLRPELRRLATTPLLCAMICALHRERRENLPTERINLYKQCIDMLLNNRDRGRKIRLELDDSYPRGLSDSQKLALIQSFAYWMMENNYSDVEIDRADAHFSRRLPRMDFPKEVTGQQIRALFVERAALLRQPVTGKIDFAHRTFQEFLAANAALDEDSLNVLLERADNDQWREAIIVAAGLARPIERKKLLKKLLAMGNKMPEKRHYLHLLAVACLETTVEVDPEVRAKVIEKAEALLPPKDDDEVVMVAKAGDAIARLLAPKPNYSSEEMARCVAALAKIGSSTAMQVLADYVDYATNTRYELTKELCKAWDAFDRSSYAHTVLSHLNELYVFNLKSWEGFEYLNNISVLSIRNPLLADFSPLKNLANLTKLEIVFETNNIHGLTQLELNRIVISDLSPLASLFNLTELLLIGHAVSDLSPLTSLFNLADLRLWGNAISDLSPLASFSNLTKFVLIGDAISDLSPLASLSNLTRLVLTGDAISDLNPLASLSNLTQLVLTGDAISDLNPLASLCNLTQLELTGDAISDLSPLASLCNLTQLELTGDAI